MLASNDEREQVITQLQQHYVDGRLDNDEMTARIDQVWSSRTRGELQRVLQDLPTLAPRHEEPTPARKGGLRERTGLSTLQLVLIAVAAIILLPIVFRILRGIAPIVIVGVIIWLFMRNRASRH